MDVMEHVEHGQVQVPPGNETTQELAATITTAAAAVAAAMVLPACGGGGQAAPAAFFDTASARTDRSILGVPQAASEAASAAAPALTVT